MEKKVAIFTGYVGGSSRNPKNLEDNINKLIKSNHVFVYKVDYQAATNGYGQIEHSAMVFYKYE